MTVCIAALADDSRALVMATDQMQSFNVGLTMPVQFETSDVPKMHRLTDHAVVLAAGTTNFAYDIVQAARSRIAQEENQTDSIEEIAEILRQEYQEYRRTYLVRWLLEPR